MQTIKLPKGEWTFDPSKPLGKPGGFGTVFAGMSGTFGAVAVKRLHLTASDAAHREMRIATELAGRSLTHVIPVFDAGEDPDSGSYFVVMPRAEKSLQNELDGGVRFRDFEAAGVLLQILAGLIEVNDIVHRDLKPPNILFHDGQWKIADFGIARFVEDSTSLRTLKDCLSPQYAAPEQWQYLHATSATDLYALGCIGYALLQGTPPFDGRTRDELRDQHIKSDPPTLSGCDPRLVSLLTMMLRKPAAARPNLQRVHQILSNFVDGQGKSPSGSFDRLAEAGANVARQQAQVETKQQVQLLEAQSRDALAENGRKILAELIARLYKRIQEHAPLAKNNGSAIALGKAVLRCSVKSYKSDAALPADAFRHSKWDVVAAEELLVDQEYPKYQWGSSLWYCKMPGETEFRWHETSYFSFGGSTFAPFSLIGQIDDADLAAAPIMHLYQVAFGPAHIDDENEEEFIERWSTLLALAAEGKLGHPRHLPLGAGFWKQQFVA